MLSTAAKVIARQDGVIGRTEAYNKFLALVRECEDERFAAESREAYLRLQRVHEDRLAKAAEELGL